jgi:hypothetical protein
MQDAVDAQDETGDSSAGNLVGRRCYVDQLHSALAKVLTSSASEEKEWNEDRLDRTFQLRLSGG